MPGTIDRAELIPDRRNDPERLRTVSAATVSRQQMPNYHAGTVSSLTTPKRSALPTVSRYSAIISTGRTAPTQYRRNGQPKKQRTGATRRNQTASSSADSPEIRKKIKKIRSSLCHSGIALSALSGIFRFLSFCACT